MDDVISQGREPDRDSRSPSAARRRVAAGLLAVAAAGAAVVGVGLRHGSGSGPPATTPAAASHMAASGGVSAIAVPDAPAPLPQSHPAIVVCAPSTGVCSMRGARIKITLRFFKVKAG